MEIYGNLDKTTYESHEKALEFQHQEYLESIKKEKNKIIIAIGSTCIDFFIPLPVFPKENGKYRIEVNKKFFKESSNSEQLLEDSKQSQDTSIQGKEITTPSNEHIERGTEDSFQSTHAIKNHRQEKSKEASLRTNSNERLNECANSHLHNQQQKTDLQCKVSLTSIGGNVNNFLYAYTRLATLHNNKDISANLCTVIAKDMISSFIREWHQRIREETNGILNLDFVVEREGEHLTSPLTYILVVDDTRTCIHLPCEDMPHLNAIDDTDIMQNLLRIAEENDIWLYSDTRHGGLVNALLQHKMWHYKNIPLILDCEKWRGDSMIEQLKHVKYCFTNSEFPMKFWNEYLKRDMEDFTLHKATMSMWDLRLRKCGFIIRTVGDQGSYIVKMEEESDYNTDEQRKNTKSYENLDYFLQDVLRGATQNPEITFGRMKYGNDIFSLLYCTACVQNKIVDTTGAGDTFIGAFIFYLQHSKLPLYEIQKLATRCSSFCLTEYGNHFTFSLEDLNR